MSPQLVLAIMSLVMRSYGINPALATCISYYESRHNALATSGVAFGHLQFTEETAEWFATRARNDLTLHHRDLLEDPIDLHDPVQASVLFAWAVRTGQIHHWDTHFLCQEVHAWTSASPSTRRSSSSETGNQ